MRIAILTYGTRGDVQPYVVLADHLKQRGHDVVMTACTNVAPMVDQAGLSAVSIPIDSQEFFESEAGRRILASGKTLQFLGELGEREAEQRDGLDEALLDCCDGAQLLVPSVLTVARAVSIAERSAQPLLPVYTLPTEPTGAWPSPYLAPGGRIPSRVARRATHRVFEASWWRGARPHVDALRARLGLGPSRESPFAMLRRNGTPIFHFVSPTLLPEPPDWPAHIANIGAPVVPEELRKAWGDGTSHEELTTWLDAGSPPLYFGFGSMPVLDPAAAIRTVTTTAEALGVRALIGAGWSSVNPGISSDGQLYVAPTLDHDRVLPRCRAAVHHGGAGTTHTILAAGIPAVVASVFADQSLWGRRVRDLGVGDTLPYRKLTSASLTDRLTRLLTDEVTERSRALGAQIHADDPLDQITEAVEALAGTAP